MVLPSQLYFNFRDNILTSARMIIICRLCGAFITWVSLYLVKNNKVPLLAAERRSSRNTLFLNGIPPSDNKEHYLNCSILLAGFKSIAEIEYLVSKLAKF